MAHAPQKDNRLLLRLSLPVLIISGLLLALGVGGAVYVQRLQKSASRRIASQVAGILAAEQLEIVFRETRTQLNQFLLTGNVDHLENAAELRSDRERWLNDADRLSETDETRALIAEIRQGTLRFEEGLRQVMPRNGMPPSSEAVRALTTDLFPTAVLNPAEKLLDRKERQIASSSRQNEVLADRLSWGLLVVGVLGAVAGVVGGYGMARTVGRSIVQLTLPIRDVAGKLDDLTGTMTVVADPKLENLETVLQEISRRVSDVIERLHRSQQEALRAEQLAAVGQIAAGLAHELRNPLMSMKILIQSAASSASETPLDHEDLSVLNQEVLRLEELVETFLNFARPPQPEKKPAVLQDIIRQTLPFVARRAFVRNVDIRKNLPDKPLTIQADVGQVRQVLVNLLLNALEAVPAGGEIVIEVEPVLSGREPEFDEGRGAVELSECVELRVQDNGKGLPQRLGDRIFEPFVTTSETGMGLGLSICRRIVEAHGGTITAANRADKGAVFTIRFPLEPEPTGKIMAYAETAGD